MASKLGKPSDNAIYKEIFSRIRMSIETAGRDFIMHDAGLIVTIQAFGKHVVRLAEPDELPLDHVMSALFRRGALHHGTEDCGIFERGPSCEAFVVFTHDAVGIWPDEELPEGMLDARGIPLGQVVIRDVNSKREYAR